MQGHCSRREADELVRRGWILVNGAVCHEMGYKVTSEDQVQILPEGRLWLGEKTTVVINKPPGFVSGPAENNYPSALDILRGGNFGGTGEAPLVHRDGLAPLGRLDVDSAGLLVLSQEGTLARTVIGPQSLVEKEYVVKVKQQLSPRWIQKLSSPDFVLDEKKLKPAKVEAINETQFRMILTEGRKRQIRRMCELIQLDVVTLKRIRIGPIHLGELKRGQWRLLSQQEWTLLQKSKK